MEESQEKGDCYTMSLLQSVDNSLIVDMPEADMPQCSVQGRRLQELARKATRLGELGRKPGRPSMK